jgi:tetratricopeptide (TPR) repeat protein
MLVLQPMEQGKRFWGACILLLILGCNPEKSGKNTAEIPEDPRKGLESFFQMVGQYPDSIKLYENLVDTLANRGLYAEAAAWCDSAMKREPEFTVGWLLAKGDLFRMAKKYDSAISAYRNYLNFFPDDEQILLNLANTYAEKGDSLALPLCRQIASLYPTADTKANTAFIAGIYYNMAGEFAKARVWFDSAITLQYTFTEAWMERGYSYFDAKMYKEAEANFMQLTNINKGNADAWYWLGKSLEAQGKTEKAMDYYARAYSLDRNLTDARRAIERLRK